MELTIRWQRLVNEEGKTCDRCGGTEEEVRRSVRGLASSLGSLGMRVVLREEKLSPQEFAKEPGEPIVTVFDGWFWLSKGHLDGDTKHDYNPSC